MTTQQNYQDMVTVYTTQLRNLFIAPADAAAPKAARRGAQIASPVVLVERAEQLADTSQQLGQLTADFLTHDDRAVREAAEMKLLAQATAEIEVARVLLEMAPDEMKPTSRAAATRSAGFSGVQRSIDKLAGVLETPLANVFPKAAGRPTRGTRAADSEQTKTQLTNQVQRSLNDICQQTSRIGGRAVRDLLLMDKAVLLQGVALVSQDVAHQLDELISGVSAIARRLVSSALRLLQQAYEWVLSLLGKEIEQKARQKVIEWLDELRGGSSQGGLFDQLVQRIYTPDAIGQDVAGWLANTQAETSKILQTTEAVRELAEKYKAKSNSVERLFQVIALANLVPIVKTSPGQLVVAGLLVGLLGYVLYAGYDHVDSNRQIFGFTIPDRVEGVRETVQKALGIA